MIDFHMVRDLIPTVSNLFFSKKLSDELRLSYAQAMIMAGTGLQHKSVDEILSEVNMEASQALALFNKSITRIARNLKEIYMEDAESKFDAKIKGSKIGEDLKRMEPGRLDDDENEYREVNRELYGDKQIGIEDELLAKRDRVIADADTKAQERKALLKKKLKKVKGNPNLTLDVDLDDSELKGIKIGNGNLITKKR